MFDEITVVMLIEKHVIVATGTQAADAIPSSLWSVWVHVLRQAYA